MSRQTIRIFLLLLAAFLLAPSGAYPAKAKLYALLLQANPAKNPVVLEDFSLNKKAVLLDLGNNEPPASLTKAAYGRKPQVSLATVESLRLTGDRLQVFLRSGKEIAAVPRNFKWPPRSASVATAQMVKRIRLSGVHAGTRKKFESTMEPGQVVYFFPFRPGPDAIAFAVAEVLNTEAGYEEFLASHAESSRAGDAREFLAAAYLRHAGEALDGYDTALREQTGGFGRLAEARQWFDRAQSMHPKAPALPETKKRLTNTEGEVAKLFQAARKAREAAQFARAEGILKPLLHFRAEFPQLDTELNAIREEAFQFHVRRAEAFLAEEKFTAAVEETKLAGQWKSGDAVPALQKKIERGRAAHEKRLAVEQASKAATQAANRKDFLGAFEALRPVALRYPSDTGLQERFQGVQSTLRADVLARCPEVEKTYTPLKQGDVAGERQVLAVYLGLAGLAGISNKDKEVDFWHKAMKDYLSVYYYARARTMVSSTTRPTALAYAFLQQAHAMALAGKRNQIREIPLWQPVVERSLRLQLDLTVTDSTPELNAAAVATQLNRLLTIELQKAGLPHLQILGNRRDPRSALAPNTLELKIDLLRASVQDARQTEPVSSEYFAGSRQVLNSEWEKAKTGYDEAVAKFERLSTLNPRKMKKQQRKAYEETLQETQAAMRNAKQALDTTPTYNQEEDVRAYQFSRNAIKRTAQIEMSYQWLRGGAVLAADEVRHQETAEGVEITGVEKTDRNNHHNQEASLPDNATMRGRSLRALQTSLAEKFLSHLEGFILKDLERAKDLSKKNNHETAAELYLRFLFNSRPANLERTQAVDYLRSQFNLVTLNQWLLTESGAETNRADNP